MIQTPSCGAPLLGAGADGLDVRDDVAEHVADGWAQESQDHDHDDCDEDEDQSVFDETLSLPIEC